jgi:hypothetical protein
VKYILRVVRKNNIYIIAKALVQLNIVNAGKSMHRSVLEDGTEAPLVKAVGIRVYPLLVQIVKGNYLVAHFIIGIGKLDIGLYKPSKSLKSMESGSAEYGEIRPASLTASFSLIS